MSSAVAAVATYSLIIVLGAVAGSLVVVLTQQATRLLVFLAFAAGVMLGAACFHMLPEAYQDGGSGVLTLVPAGFVFIFVLERYLFSHGEPDSTELPRNHALGLTAFLGLSVHTLIDGVALGSAVNEGVGLMTVIAIAAHKVPSALSLASIFKAEGRSNSRILAYAFLYGLMVPVGAVLYFGFDAVLRFEKLSPWALSFSAGTFLYIALLDLLPYVKQHNGKRWGGHLLALITGVFLMLLLAQVMEHH